MPTSIREIEIDTNRGSILMRGAIYEEGRGPLDSETEVEITIPYTMGPNGESLRLMVAALSDMLEEECNFRLSEIRGGQTFTGSSRPTLEFNIHRQEPFIRRIR